MTKTKINSTRNRKMQKGGAFTIPADVRKRLGFKGGAAVDMQIMEDGSIILRPATPVCAICEKNTALKRKMGVPICVTCSAAIGELYEEQ